VYLKKIKAVSVAIAASAFAVGVATPPAYADTYGTLQCVGTQIYNVTIVSFAASRTATIFSGSNYSAASGRVTGVAS